MEEGKTVPRKKETVPERRKMYLEKESREEDKEGEEMIERMIRGRETYLRKEIRDMRGRRFMR